MEFNLFAVDIEGDSIIYVPVSMPTGMTLSDEGDLFWNPVEIEGRFEIIIGLTNAGCPDTNRFSL